MIKIIRTVAGDIPAGDISGTLLVHEHVTIDLYYRNLDVDLLLAKSPEVVADVQAAKAAGVGLIVDVTPYDIGRNHLEQVEISAGSGVHIVSCTGYYLPRYYPYTVALWDEPRLADFMVGEITEGIAGSAVRAGVIGEIGWDEGQDAETEALQHKVFRAAAMASRRTGAPIVTHTFWCERGYAQLQVLLDAGARADRILIGHMDCAKSMTDLYRIVEAGAYVGIDRIGLPRYNSDETRVRMLMELVAAGFAERILISSDIARRSRLGGNAGYRTVNRFTQMLAETGAGKALLHQLTHVNPKAFLSIGKVEPG